MFRCFAGGGKSSGGVNRRRIGDAYSGPAGTRQRARGNRARGNRSL